MLGGYVMNDSIEAKIRRALLECSERRLSLDEFRAWFVPLSWNIEESGDPQAMELAHQIDGILAEASSGGWTEEQLCEQLTSSVLAKSIS
jgi:hypothetical protein